MPDEQKVTVTCNGVELLSWSFEFPQERESEVTPPGGCEGSDKDGADRRRDENLRDMFGG